MNKYNQPNKKVLFVANLYRHLFTFHLPYIQMLKDNGCQVDVLAAPDDREVTNADNCYYWDLSRSPYHFRNIIAYKQIKRLVAKERYDLIHCHTAMAAAIVRLATRTMRKKYGTKVIYTVHGFYFYKGSPKRYWLPYYSIEKFLSRWTDAIVLINEEDYNLVLKNGFRNKKTYYLNGVGVNSQRFAHADMETGKKQRSIEGYTDNQFLMIYVAEYIFRKNHLFLVDASLELAKKMDDFKILFVGRGELEQEIKKYAASVGADKYIDFLGVRFDLALLLPMCDIFISSSRQEGLGLSVAEAMFCGLPVIATQNRGHREMIIHGETGFLFEQEDMADFVKNADTLYKNPNIRTEIGRAACLHIQKFKIEQSLRKMAEIYGEMLQVQISAIANVE